MNLHSAWKMANDSIMTLIECLEKVLDSKVLLAPSLNEGGSIVLRETQANMKVQIMGIPPTVKAIHIGKINHLPLMKKAGKSWNLICDYLLIFHLNLKYYAVFIELKKSMPMNTQPKEQLRRSLPVLDYLLSVCKIECKTKSKPLVRYALIAEKISKRMSKQGVKAKPCKRESYESVNIKTCIGKIISVSKLIER